MEMNLILKKLEMAELGHGGAANSTTEEEKESMAPA